MAEPVVLVYRHDVDSTGLSAYRIPASEVPLDMLAQLEAHNYIDASEYTKRRKRAKPKDIDADMEIILAYLDSMWTDYGVDVRLGHKVLKPNQVVFKEPIFLTNC
jgi:hypothetical protein